MTGRFVPLTAMARLKTPSRSVSPNGASRKRPSMDVMEAVRPELSGVTERRELSAVARRGLIRRSTDAEGSGDARRRAVSDAR
jgi:hypothetical protein